MGIWIVEKVVVLAVDVYASGLIVKEFITVFADAPFIELLVHVIIAAGIFSVYLWVRHVLFGD